METCLFSFEFRYKCFEKAEVENCTYHKNSYRKLCLLSKAENITNLIKEIPK